MNKFIITVIAKDRPGIIAAVTQVLFEQNCNIEDIRQNILQDEFAGSFLVGAPAALHSSVLEAAILSQTKAMDLVCHVKKIDSTLSQNPQIGQVEPFIISTRGPDCKGLVAGVTAILARHHVNVTQLQAVFRGGNQPEDNVMIYEVDVPNDADIAELRADLRARADELHLEINFQHKDIFEAINRV